MSWTQTWVLVGALVATTVLSVWSREERIINLQNMLVKMSAQLEQLRGLLEQVRKN